MKLTQNSEEKIWSGIELNGGGGGGFYLGRSKFKRKKICQE